MKTITVKCDYCENVIYSVDVITGAKYLGGYSKTLIRVHGVDLEFCNSQCLQKQLGWFTVSSEGPTAMGSPKPPQGVPGSMDNAPTIKGSTSFFGEAIENN